MRNKFLSLIICFVLIVTVMPIDVKSVSLGISASSAVVMVAQTGEVLYEHNAHVRRPMASTTKIMTSLIALEKTDLHKEIKVSADELNVEGTSMGLLAGDTVTYEGLVYGMLLQSGNDASNVVASKIGGSIDDFLKIMNNRAKEIGMKNTNFATPSGLDDEKHYSTAYDMALLACEAAKNPDFRYISSQKKATVCYGNPPYNRTLTNHNKMLSFYDGCIGMKTGFTKKSGRCLVTAAERNGVVIVAVTLNAPDDWNDHKLLLDYGFQNAEINELKTEKNFSVSVVGGNVSEVIAIPQNKMYMASKKDFSDCKAHYLLDKFAYAPVNEGDILGKVVYTSDGKYIGEVLLVAGGKVSAKKRPNVKKNFWIRIKDFFNKIF